MSRTRCFIVAAALLTGCTDRDSGIAISIDEPRPLRAELKPTGDRPIGDRFLVIPVGLEEGEGSAKFGSFGVVSSAWTGKGFLSGYAYRLLNLIVVDLQTRQQRTVFERQVALGRWQHPQRAESEQAWFENELILIARNDDTTGDRKIDLRDEVRCFVYDLATGTLRQASPIGHSVEHVEPVARALILTLRPNGDDSAASIYRFDPQSGTGEFVAENIKP